MCIAKYKMKIKQVLLLIMTLWGGGVYGGCLAYICCAGSMVLFVMSYQSAIL